MLPHLIFTLRDLRVDVVGVADGSMLVLMIETPIPFILLSALFYTYIMPAATLFCPCFKCLDITCHCSS
jgi:hypothetical protein